MDPDSFDYLEQRYCDARSNAMPWARRSDRVMREYELFKEVLRRHAGATFFGDNSYVSPEAKVFTDEFAIGHNSWVAKGAIVRGQVSIGSNSSVSAYAHLAGHIVIGNHVMIASLSSIYAFNHGIDRVDIPMTDQPHTREGVVIEDDVWIGAHSLILDGVRVGQGSIVAGGAVVTRSIPAFSIVAGNAGRVVKGRKSS